MINIKFKISSGQDNKPDRYALYSIFAAFLLSTTPHLLRLPPWFLIVGLVVVYWQYRIINLSGRSPRSVIRIIIVFAVIFLIAKHYHTLLGRDAGVAMLIALTMLKFLELKTMRDYMLVVFLCMFIALTSFLYSQSLLLGVYLLAVVMGLFTVLMVLNHSNRQHPLMMLKRSARMVLMAFPVALLLFLLFPRLQGGLIGLPGDSHSGLTGMAESMKPGSINELNLSESVAFRAEFKSKPPQQQQRYWRGLVLENYKQGEWKESKSKEVVLPRGTYKEEAVISYSLLQEPSNKKWIFALDLPVSKAPTLNWATGQTLRSSKLIRNRQQLKLRSVIGGKGVTEISDAVLLRNKTKSSIKGKRVRALADTLYKRAGSDRAYIDAVLNYYKKNEFFYTLRPPLLGEMPVQDFMLDTRKGYCEHYASSFTAMMRLVGIPARVVIGYQGGEWNARENYLIVRQSDAHAWSEVWLDEVGWLRVDPTAAVAPERIDYGLSAVRLLLEEGQTLGQVSANKIQSLLAASFISRSIKGARMFWDGVNTRWYKWVINYGKNNQKSLLRALGFESTDWSKLVYLLIGLVAFVLSIQAWFLFRRKKTINHALRQYEKYCQRLKRVGISRILSEGPANFAQRVITRRPDLAVQVNRVTSAYISIQYAGLAGNNQQRALNRAVKMFKPAKHVSREK